MNIMTMMILSLEEYKTYRFVQVFKSLLQRYQENLQEKMRGSDFAFDGVNLLYYDFNKISINRAGSYT